jgi:DNA-binding LacI/PurR family transcriptional regulator
LRPPLSTIALPHYEMGQRAENYLIEQVKHGEIKPVQHTVACPYVGHESV